VRLPDYNQKDKRFLTNEARKYAYAVRDFIQTILVYDYIYHPSGDAEAVLQYNVPPSLRYKVLNKQNVALVRDKNIVLFDDSIDNGITMRTLIEEVIKFKPIKITIAALIVKKSTFDILAESYKFEIKYIHSIGDALFEDQRKDLWLYYDYIGVSMKEDNLWVLIELNRVPSRDEIASICQGIGELTVFSEDERMTDGPITRIDIILNNPEWNKRNEYLARYWNTDSICKIRLFIDDIKKTIRLVFVFKPDVSENEVLSPGITPLPSNGKPRDEVVRDTIIFCGTLNLAQEVIRLFKTSFPKLAITTKSIDMGWPAFVNCYGVKEGSLKSSLGLD
jgi:hypothetical protein